VPIDRILHKVLTDYRAFLGSWSGPLFRDRNGKRRSSGWISDRVAETMVAVGLVDENGKPKYSPHALRHFAGSLWIEADISLEVIKDWLGHKSVRTTEQIYIHEINARRSRGVTQLHTLADMFPGVQSSPRPVQPALPAPDIVEAAPVERVINMADAVAIDAIPTIAIPDDAPQWVSYAVRLLQAGWGVVETAAELGIQYDTLTKTFQRIGLPMPREVRTAAKKARARRLLRDGSKLADIARELNSDYSSAKRWVRPEKDTSGQPSAKPLKKKQR
jgi:transposase-like protein